MARTHLFYSATFIIAFASGTTAASAATTIVLTSGQAVTENFNTLPSSGTSNALPNGVQIFETGSNANNSISAGTGSDNAGNTYNFGATGSADRALGGLRSGSLVPSFGIAFTNSTGSIINGLAISYFGEMYRLGTAGREDRLGFQYAIGTDSIVAGSFRNFDALDFVSPITTGATGDRFARTAISAFIGGLNIAQGQSFTLRFQDLDANGSDDGLAIDDFSLTPTIAAAVPEPATWAMMLLGFGAVGGAARYRRRKTNVAYA